MAKFVAVPHRALVRRRQISSSDWTAFAWIILCAVLPIWGFPSWVEASEVASSFTLDGRLFSDAAGNTPLVDGSVALRFRILNESKTCILYEEQQTVSTIPTNGYFSVQVGSAVGSGKRSANDSGHAMSVVYQNASDISGFAVSDLTPCTHTAASGAKRHLRVTVTASGIAGGERTLSPDLSMDSVPHALVAGRAETLGGVAADQFLRVNTSGSNQLTQANLESIFSSTSNVTELSSLIAGTNTNYVRSVANTGASIPSYAGDPSTPSVGSIWYDSVGQTIRLQTGGGAVSLATGASSLPAAGGTAAAPGYAFSGDTNTGMFSSVADTVQFSTNSTERMRITSTGNVGIGTASPLSPLHISGSSSGGVQSYVRNSDDRGLSINPYVTSPGDGYRRFVDFIAWGDSTNGIESTMRFFTQNSSNLYDARMVISGSGNVGIGTTNAQVRLDVAGEVKVGNTSAACSAATQGSIRYNTGLAALEFCNGSSWNLVQAAACSDATPNLILFNDEANQTTSTLIESNIVQVTGFNCTVPVTVSGVGGPQFQICSDAACSSVVQGWTSSPSSIVSGQYLQMRQTSDAAGGATVTATLIAGTTASLWNISTAGGDCVATTPPVGTICADGTVFAGMSPDSSTKMFTTRCDYGQSWDGAFCTGTALPQLWSNGTSTTTGIINQNTGKSNSAALAALSDSGAPYSAAVACETMDQNGHTDWYLPSTNELQILAINKGAIRNFTTDSNFGRYWSSSEYVISEAYSVRFSDSAIWSRPKSLANFVRCVRR